MKAKELFFIGIGLMVSMQTFAQDTIYQKSDTPSILAKVVEVNPTTVKYKKHSNIEGPTYTIEKNKIEKIIYQNGEVEKFKFVDANGTVVNRQTSLDLIPGSRIFLTYSATDDKRNVNGTDAKGMLKSYIEGKTTCVVVDSREEADFEMELQTVKKIMADRKARIEVKHLMSDKVVFESKWSSGSSSAFSGYSGSRAAIGKVVKKRLLKKYPEIKI